MNRSRTTTTTETYTAHYNLSRTSEGAAALKGPFKTWNPQPHHLLSESETDSAPKRHTSRARTVQNAPSAHPAVMNPSHSTYQLTSNSRTNPSLYPHQRVSSPAPHRPDHTTHAYPMEPPHQPQAQPRQNSSVLNFIRPHIKGAPKPENHSTRRVDDLHRAAVTSAKHQPTSSFSASLAARAPAPPLSYSSPSSAEPSPRNSTDSGHQPSNNHVSSDNESRRHHHSIWNPYVDSKLYAEYAPRKVDPVSAQQIAEKKAKDRQDMVAKVAEALSPPMSTRPRVPETISLGQLSLLRADDPGSSRRAASTPKASESQSRPQAYPSQTTSSQSRQRLHPQDFDPSIGVDSQSKNHKQPINTTSRPLTEPSARTQPTPTPAVPHSKPTPVPTSKAPPPSSAKSPPSSRTAANPWPFNQASSTERTSSKQSSREQSARSTRVPTPSNPTNPQPFVPNPGLENPVPAYPAYPRESLHSTKIHARESGPPVPPKQVVNNVLPVKPPMEQIDAHDFHVSTSKSITPRTAGNSSAENQPGSAPPPAAPPPPSSSVPSASQFSYMPKSKPELQVQSEQAQAVVSLTNLHVKSPTTAHQISIRPLSKPAPSAELLPVPTTSGTASGTSQQIVFVPSAQQPTTSSSATPKLSAVHADLSLAVASAETTVAHNKLHERLPIQESQVLSRLEAPPSLEDKDRLALVRQSVMEARNIPMVPLKETTSPPGPSADSGRHEFALTRAAAPSHSQSNSGKSTPAEINQYKTPFHIQWIPPAEAETSSLSSVEEDDMILPKVSNTVSQPSLSTGVWTTTRKVTLRSGEMSYASQAPNLYVVPQKLSRSNPSTPPEPDSPDVVVGDSVPVEVPNKPFTSTDISSRNPAPNAERSVAGAWTTKTLPNNISNASTAPETLPKPPLKSYENVVLASRSPMTARSNGEIINGKLLSIQAATAMSNGSSVGMTPGAWTTVTKHNRPPTIFESEKRNESLGGNAVMGNTQTMSSTMRQALNASGPVAGAWTTKVTDVQPSHSNNTTPKPTPPRNPSPPSVTPKYQLTTTTGSGSNTPSSSQSADHYSAPNAGTSHVDRVPISGHPSTPAPNRPSLRQTPPPLSIASTTPDTDSLLTPSSLNSPRSTLLITQPPPPPPSVPITITPPQPPPDKEKTSKNRILEFFRPKQTVPTPSHDVSFHSKQSTKDKEKSYEEKKEPPALFSPPNAKTSNILPQSHPPPRPKSPKLFSSLKLFSKRNRTVSTASIDALDGTTTTVMNSPSSSAPEIPGAPSSPPIRDALLATQEWRNNEANRFTKTKRPHRPGVTFDCIEDVAPIHMVPSRFKLSRSYYTEDDDF